MAHDLAQVLAWAATAMTIAAMGYMLASLVAARAYLRSRRMVQVAGFAPGLKR